MPDPGSPGVVRGQEAQHWLGSRMRLIVSAVPADLAGGSSGTLKNQMGPRIGGDQGGEWCAPS